MTALLPRVITTRDIVIIGVFIMGLLWGLDSDTLLVALYSAVFSDSAAEQSQVNGSALLAQHSSLHEIALVEILDYLLKTGAITYDFGDTQLQQFASAHEYRQLIDRLEITTLLELRPNEVAAAAEELKSHTSPVRNGLYAFVIFHCCQQLLQQKCAEHQKPFLPMFSQPGVISRLPAYTTFVDLNEVFDRLLYGSELPITDADGLNLDTIIGYTSAFLQFYIESGGKARLSYTPIIHCHLIDMVLCELYGFGEQVELTRWTERPC